MKKQKLTVILLALFFLYFLFSQSVGIYRLTTWPDATPSLWASTLFDALVLIGGIIGLLQYHFSTYKRFKLLRLYLAFYCFQYPLSIVTSLLSYSYLRDKYNIPGYSIITPIIVILSALICFYALFVINKARKPQFILYESEALSYAQFEPANQSVRFLNRFIDVGVILLFIYNFYESLQFFFISGGDFASFLTPGYLFLIIFGLYFYYYFFLEALFKITVGKILTDTTVVNEEGAYASTSQVLGRTFCRFIPFEPFSFLFGQRGWHDSMTNTYVIKECYDWEPHKTAL